MKIATYAFLFASIHFDPVLAGISEDLNSSSVAPRKDGTSGL